MAKKTKIDYREDKNEHDRKMHKVMHEYKHGELHSGSKHGPKVKSRTQAIAIGLSGAEKAQKSHGANCLCENCQPEAHAILRKDAKNIANAKIMSQGKHKVGMLTGKQPSQTSTTSPTQKAFAAAPPPRAPYAHVQKVQQTQKPQTQKVRGGGDFGDNFVDLIDDPKTHKLREASPKTRTGERDGPKRVEGRASKLARKLTNGIRQAYYNKPDGDSIYKYFDDSVGTNKSLHGGIREYALEKSTHAAARGAVSGLFGLASRGAKALLTRNSMRGMKPMTGKKYGGDASGNPGTWTGTAGRASQVPAAPKVSEGAGKGAQRFADHKAAQPQALANQYTATATQSKPLSGAAQAGKQKKLKREAAPGRAALKQEVGGKRAEFDKLTTGIKKQANVAKQRTSVAAAKIAAGRDRRLSGEAEMKQSASRIREYTLAKSGAGILEYFEKGRRRVKTLAAGKLKGASVSSRTYRQSAPALKRKDRSKLKSMKAKAGSRPTVAMNKFGSKGKAASKSFMGEKHEEFKYYSETPPTWGVEGSIDKRHNPYKTEYGKYPKNGKTEYDSEMTTHDADETEDMADREGLQYSPFEPERDRGRIGKRMKARNMRETHSQRKTIGR